MLHVLKTVRGFLETINPSTQRINIVYRREKIGVDITGNEVKVRPSSYEHFKDALSEAGMPTDFLGKENRRFGDGYFSFGNVPPYILEGIEGLDETVFLKTPKHREKHENQTIGTSTGSRNNLSQTTKEILQSLNNPDYIWRSWRKTQT